MKNDLVVMDNNLIRASYKLTANEMRLVLCALAQIPKDAEVDPGKAYYITKEDFVKLGVEPKNVAREIREACSELLNRIVVVDTAMGKLKFHWLHSVLHFKSEIFERLKKEYPNSKNDEEFIQQLRKYNLLDSLPIIAKSDDNIVARIVFHENMIPYISQLKEQFTKLNLKDVFQFSSFYSFRFYLMMMQFKETGFCKISIAELRDSLDLNNKYQLFADLKKWVIDTAIDEINEKSPHTVGYELIKKRAMECLFWARPTPRWSQTTWWMPQGSCRRESSAPWPCPPSQGPSGSEVLRVTCSHTRSAPRGAPPSPRVADSTPPLWGSRTTLRTTMTPTPRSFCSEPAQSIPQPTEGLCSTEMVILPTPPG